MIRTLQRLTCSLALAALCLGAAASPSLGLEIYEPDSPYNEAPNDLLASLPGAAAAKATAKVVAGGAQLVSSNPQFANAVVSIGHGGNVQSEVYVRLQRVLILKGDDGSRANSIASALNEARAHHTLRADKILPGRHGNQFTIQADRDVLVTIDSGLAAAQGTRPATLVLKWMDNLRMALGGVPFAQSASRGGAFFAGSRIGHASWYGPGFNGHRAASGERFDQTAMTAAHKTLPFGTVLLVTNLTTHRSCLVRVNDRGPYVAGRELDLSAAAAKAIGMRGVATVRIDVLRQ